MTPQQEEIVTRLERENAYLKTQAALVLGRDVALYDLQSTLERSGARSRALQTISDVISAAPTAEVGIHQATDAFVRLMNFENCAIVLGDTDGLRVVASAGYTRAEAERLGQLRHALLQPLHAACASAAFITPDSPGPCGTVLSPVFALHSFLVAPLVVDHVPSGFLVAGYSPRAADAYRLELHLTEEDSGWFDAIAQQLASMVANRRLLATLEDKVTERTQALRVALSDARRLSRVIENSYEAVAIVSNLPEHHYLYVNRAWERMTGWTKEEVLGKETPRLLRSGKQNNDYYRVLWETILDGRTFSSEIVDRRKDGTLFDAEIIISPIATETGTTYAEILRDITERKRLENRARDVELLRNRFIQIVSHQLRTPLSSVRWNLESLLAGELGPIESSQENFLRVTYEANNEVIRRIHEMLSIMDIEEGRSTILREKASVSGIFTSAASGFALRFRNRRIPYEFHADSGLPEAEVDAEKIRTALETLLENALTYTHEGGRVTAALSAVPDGLRFEVRDTGIGIPAREQPYVFQKFHRASNAWAMKQEATGIGLSIAKYIVEQHGGKIGFESLENQGTTFWFEIPLVAPPAKT